MAEEDGAELEEVAIDRVDGIEEVLLERRKRKGLVLFLARDFDRCQLKVAPRSPATPSVEINLREISTSLLLTWQDQFQ